MIDRKKLIAAILIGFFVVATVYPMITASESAYDPWLDINDDGIIDISDLYAIGLAYGSLGTPINKTALLLELQSRIDSMNASLVEIQSIIETLETRVTALEGDVATLQTTVGELETDIATLETRIDILNVTIVDLIPRVEALESKAGYDSIALTYQDSAVVDYSNPLDLAEGLTMIRSGSIVGLSIYYDVTSTENSPDLYITIKKNEDIVWQENIGETVGEGYKYYFTKSVENVTFEAGDSLRIYVRNVKIATHKATIDDVGVMVEFYYHDYHQIRNGNFEKDRAGTSFNDISDWNYSIVVHKGNPPTGDNLEIVDDYYFKGDKCLYSYLKTTSVSPFPGDSWVSQYLSAEEPVLTTADYITLWIGGDGYTTSSRYNWEIILILTDGTNTYSETLRKDNWDGTHYNYYNATETGADGNTWKRYTRRIPDYLDKSNLTIKIRHYQCSWDLTTASSWYRLDSIYFSDSEGNPRP